MEPRFKATFSMDVLLRDLCVWYGENGSAIYTTLSFCRKGKIAGTKLNK